MDTKDQIRSRLPIEQLVAEYCQLKKKGRNYVCLCPFHSDKNPSFLVSPDKGIAYCFACQSGGDIFSFYQKIENVDFPTAVKMLAEKAGVEIPKEHVSTKPSVSKDEKQRLKDCVLSAQEFFQTKLESTPDAHAYVLTRGMTPELLKTFALGYAPDSFSETYEFLLKKGFSRSDIVSAGLGVQKELQDERIYDRFRHRIMFPITDAQGSTIGFGGRALGESDAKYVNSPESALYHKSSVLYGLFHARDSIRATKTIVLVEGYFDAISAHKAGVANVVAVSGTALTDEHVQIIKRYADSVVLCLDQDSAGQTASSRAFGLLSRAHLKVLSVSLPAKDPDELVQRDPELFRSLITASATPYISAVIDRLRVLPDITEPSGKRIISDTLFPLLASIPTSVELRAYMEKASRSFGMVESDIANDFRTWSSSDITRRQSSSGMSTVSTTYLPYELCIGLALLYPCVRSLVPELLPSDDLQLERVRSALPLADADAVVHSIIDSIDIEFPLKDRLKVLALYCEENFPQWAESLAVREFRKLVSSANKDVMVRKQLVIVKELKDARASGRIDIEAKLLHQYQQLLKLSKMAGN